jgi:hypothetical protein
MTDQHALCWDRPGLLTVIDADVAPSLAELPHDPIGLCCAAQGLVMLPHLASAFGIADDRLVEQSIRPASDVLRRVLELDPVPVEHPRAPDRRVVGTCRQFALLSCAFLRHRGVPARARCGFASYFEPGKYLDHWVIEYRDETRGWVRVDPEILGFDYVDHPEDLQPGEFLTGGEAWRFLRTSGADPGDFGVDGVPHAWGIGEVRGNVIRDLAALNTVEMLPWDEWSRMRASYEGTSDAAFDALMDEIAEVCRAADPVLLQQTYRSA